MHGCMWSYIEHITMGKAVSCEKIPKRRPVYLVQENLFQRVIHSMALSVKLMFWRTSCILGHKCHCFLC